MSLHSPSHACVHKLPRIVRLLAIHMAFGMAVGVAFAATLVLTNTAGLRDLLIGDGSPLLPMLLFYFLFALTFGSVSMGIGVMTLPKGNAFPRNPNNQP